MGAEKICVTGSSFKYQVWHESLATFWLSQALLQGSSANCQIVVSTKIIYLLTTVRTGVQITVCDPLTLFLSPYYKNRWRFGSIFVGAYDLLAVQLSVFSSLRKKPEGHKHHFAVLLLSGKSYDSVENCHR